MLHASRPFASALTHHGVARGGAAASVRRVATRAEASAAAAAAEDTTSARPVVDEGAYDRLSMDDVVSLCKRRGFIFPSSEIYNGMAGFYDYGPRGAELKKNVKDAWWRTFVTRREDVVGLDSSIVHNPNTWESSGTCVRARDDATT